MKKYQANNMRSSRKRARWGVCTTLVIICWAFLPGLELQPTLLLQSERLLPFGEELREQAAALKFDTSMLPLRSKEEHALAQWGYSLFRDRRFSANGQIACVTCHRPESAFSDGSPRAKALSEGQRRTPSLVNVFAAHWFFWDGRAGSLAAQALGPIENPGEHGVSRTHVAKLVRDHYRQDYERHFGAFPSELLVELPDQALPAPQPALVSATVAAYSMASLDSFARLDSILAMAGRLRRSAAAVLAERTNIITVPPPHWVSAWQRLTLPQQAAVNRVGLNFGRALAAYERGLVAVNAPFDRFVARWQAQGGAEELALGDGFNESALHGLKLFMGPGQCGSCHTGPMFSDQQFHNIGLPLSEAAVSGDYLDLGRAVGLLAAKEGASHCAEHENEASESCRELPWLNSESLELVGAFKTPSLRNLLERAPYGHDGRFTSLRAVLEHYNSLPGDAGVGHREEVLEPLRFNENELNDLEEFLGTLSAPVHDLVLNEAMVPSP